MKLVNLLVIASVMILASCKQNETSGKAAQEYKLMGIVKQSITSSTSYSASIRGKQDIRIIPRVDGYLVDIAIKEGSKVKKGQTLFVLDQVAYQAALQAVKASVAVCEANVATAKLTFESKQNLFKKNIVSEFDVISSKNAFKTAEAQLAQAKAQEASAQNNMSFTVIQSPSDGVAGKLPYRKGDYVHPSIQDGLTVIADNSQMHIYFSMTERQVLDLVSEHKSIEKAIADMPDLQLQLSNQTLYAHKGRIESISGVVDASTGAVSVRAVFPNSEGFLLSGGAGSVIMPYTKDEAIVIPQEATYEIQGKTYVYKVVEGKATSAIVTVDKINNGKEYIVTDGLTVGDQIIAEGAGLVQEGTSVNTK